MANRSEESEADASDTTAVNSAWWYLVAFAAVWGVVAWAVFVGYVAGGGSASAPSAELTVLAMAILVLNPVGLYLDIDAIGRTEVEWSPDVRLYVGAAVLGIPATVFSTFVALAYLYRRHANVGTP